MRAASGSPDGCSAVVAGAVGVVSTLAVVGAGAAVGTTVGHLPYPSKLSSLDMLPKLSNTPFWQLPSSFCTRFCAPLLTRPTWRRQF